MHGLDAAALRRFDVKIRFDYLGSLAKSPISPPHVSARGFADDDLARALGLEAYVEPEWESIGQGPGRHD
jgi:hypothetical protein